MGKKENRSVLEEIIMFIPNFISLLYGMVRDNRVRLAEKALLLVTIAYVLSPLDFVPDFIPFLGQVDDILLVSLVLLRFFEQAGQEVILQHWKGNRSLLDLVRSTLRLSSLFLPPEIYEKVIKKSKYQGEVIDVNFQVDKN